MMHDLESCGDPQTPAQSYLSVLHAIPTKWWWNRFKIYLVK